MEEYKKFIDYGIFDIQDGKYESAIENISKSISLKNDWEISYFYRAVAHQALEEYDNAILDYTKAISLNKNMTDAYYNRARIILTRKDIQSPDILKAIDDLKKALELDSEFIDALYTMAVAQMKIRDYHRSLEYLEKLLSLQKDSVNAKALKKLILTKYLKFL